MTNRAALVWLGLLGVVTVRVPSAVAGPRWELALRIPDCCNGGDPTFAASVAASATDLLIGIPGQVVGRAVVFDRAGHLQAQLEAPVPSREFGRVVAASEATLAVGAPDVRRVYLYDAQTYALVQTLVGPAGSGDEFGSTVALAKGDVVVGAPFDDRNGIGTGAAYVFDRRSGGLRLALEPPAIFPGARFGAAVAVAGDDVVVGSSAQGTTNAAGNVAVYSLRTGARRWTRERPPSADGRLFGFAVAAGSRYVVAGAPCHDGEPRAGLVVVLERASGEPLFELAAPSPESCDFFGGAVAVDGSTIAVGARLAGDPDTGALHLFTASGGRLVASFADGEAEAVLGVAVSMQGGRVVVGAAGEEGEARVYTRAHD